MDHRRPGSDSSAARPRRGSGRSEASRQAILRATASLFAAHGYDKMSIEGIAAAAGVGKQTIYRWWDSKSALVAECLLEGALAPGALAPQDTGDIRADLQMWLAELFAFVGDSTHATMTRSLFAAAAENEAVGRLLSSALGAGSVLHVRLERAAAAGQLLPGASVPQLAKALVGYVIVHALERAPAPPDLPGRVVATLLP
jgi:AcrR family transcriptional regulator